MVSYRRFAISVSAAFLGLACRIAMGQTFGVEAHNTLMPASGGMAGASIARPQDLTSAINGNPASITQFRGTQFLFGGAWSEPTFNLNQTAPIPIVGPPLIDPFSAKSTAPGAPMGNIGVTQEMSAYGMPVTVGMGFISTSGGFVDFRNVPESHGTNTGLAVFSMPVTLGIQVTDRLSVGASGAMGIAFFDGPFVGIGGMTPDYALRGSLGVNYEFTEYTTIGAYYQTEQSFRFDNAFLRNPGPGQTATDVNMQLPQNIGFGLGNNVLMDGQLLVSADVLYKMWNDADLFDAIYDNQWVVQLGTQYTMGNYKLRAGYAWAQNPLDPAPGPNLGGVIQPGGLRAVRYSQGLMAITSQHRISAGIGIADVLPGVDMDLMAGGMFRDEQQLGDATQTSIMSYWVGFGLTWRFGRGSCCNSQCGEE
ncbi:MAG: OmpP1/FadL family transporter [Pirellulaceae bacterium]